MRYCTVHFLETHRFWHTVFFSPSTYLFFSSSFFPLLFPSSLLHSFLFSASVLNATESNVTVTVMELPDGHRWCNFAGLLKFGWISLGFTEVSKYRGFQFWTSLEGSSNPILTLAHWTLHTALHAAHCILQWWANIIKWTRTNIQIYSYAILCTERISEYIRISHIYRTNIRIYLYAEISTNMNTNNIWR